ncbi:MAG: hypothetical protein AB9891_08115 [Anaerolineaceae bacterium]
MKPIQIIFLLVAGGCALGLVSAPSLRYYNYQSGKLENSPWQGGTIQSPQIRADLNLDGIDDEIRWTGGMVEIHSGKEILFRSDPEWNVKQAEFGDLNWDSRSELVLLVWRDFKPWPVDRLLPAGGRIDDFHNADGQSCHLILIGWGKDKATEAWAGSALADPVKGFVIGDLDSNGRQELVTMDGDYSSPAYLPAKAVRIWEWNGFGFSRLEQINLPVRQVFISSDGDGSRGIIISTH